MGFEDWAGGDNHRFAQSIQSMRYTLAMGSRLKQDNMRIEDQVGSSFLCPFGVGLMKIS
jgi:hypothetical protein